MISVIKDIHELNSMKNKRMGVRGKGRNAEIIRTWLGDMYDNESNEILVVQDRNNNFENLQDSNSENYLYLLTDQLVDTLIPCLYKEMTRAERLCIPALFSDFNNKYYVSGDSYVKFGNCSYVRESSIASWGNSRIDFGKSVIVNNALIEAENNSIITIEDGVYIDKGTQIVARNNAIVFIGNNCSVGHDLLIIAMSNSEISIKECSKIDRECEFVAKNNGKISIGSEISISKRDRFGVVNRTITVGDNCLFSFDIAVEQNHKIYDNESKSYVSDNRDTVIGDNVWIGKGAFIQSGAEIGDGSIVGAMSFVNKKIPAHSEVVGCPAKIIESDIKWER